MGLFPSCSACRESAAWETVGIGRGSYVVKDKKGKNTPDTNTAKDLPAEGVWPFGCSEHAAKCCAVGAR